MKCHKSFVLRCTWTYMKLGHLRIQASPKSRATEMKRYRPRWLLESQECSSGHNTERASKSWFTFEVMEMVERAKEPQKSSKS